MIVKQLKDLWQLAFADSPQAINAFFSTAYSPARCQVLMEDDRVVAALHWLDTQYRGQKLAYLYAVATHPDFRRRGLCRTLMNHTEKLLKAQGYAGALLSPASDGLRKMYGSMGYRDCCYCAKLSVPAAAKPAVLRPVGIDEYARLRRQYLPEDGVIQEGENLTYLASFAKFYAGDDFLLAASVEGAALQGVELLGNTQAAGGITAALGCTEGTFRTPGNQTMLAMFLPLKPSAQAPGYLGFPFD